MRFVLALGALMLLGAIAASCALWAGVEQGAPIALALGGFTVAIVLPVVLDQMGNWGVPGDEPPPRWSRTP
jgi:hypothetical protein